MQKRPWEDLNPLQLGHWSGPEAGGFDRPIPAREVAGGQGQVAREKEWLKAHLLEGLSGARDGRRGLVGEELSATAGVLNDSGALARERRREVAG